MYDVLNNLQNKSIQCLDHGHVTLIDTMPRLVPDSQKTADYAIVQAARVSYGDGTKSLNEDRGLIRYLMRHVHTTPFEMIEFKFHCKMPVFIARQWIRHRTANVNEYSGRYSIMKDEFYKPSLDNVRQQSKTNKQGSEGCIENLDAANFLSQLDGICSKAYECYEKGLESGVAREQSRMILPLNLYTEWYWKIDLHNLFHFLSLRCDSHAQWEIRVFADAMLNLISPIVPWAVEAWEDYHDHRGGKKLTRLEIEAIKKSLEGKVVSQLNSENKREQLEWKEKAASLGLIVQGEKE
jgi:thymidylate synthase (FAD)